MRIRTYTELIQHSTFLDRFHYLVLHGSVGRSTFGFDRYLNQRFYTSAQWRQVRNYVIARDSGLDLGVSGHEIHNRLLIHHMNPITASDIVANEEDLLDPEFLITTCHLTHNAIHYGDAEILPKAPVVRRPGDTKLW